jgi:hypothetical protein
MVPLTEHTYEYYVCGGGIAYIIIALFGEIMFGGRRKFYPLFIWIIINLIY